MKNESFRRSFSMLCAAVGLIVLMGIAVAGQMESTEQQNQKLLSENFTKLFFSSTQFSIIIFKVNKILSEENEPEK